MNAAAREREQREGDGAVERNPMGKDCTEAAEGSNCPNGFGKVIGVSVFSYNALVPIRAGLGASDRCPLQPLSASGVPIELKRRAVRGDEGQKET